MKRALPFIIVMLFICTSAEAEPTIQETKSFIKKVLNSKELTNKHLGGNDPGYDLKSFTFVSECKIKMKFYTEPFDGGWHNNIYHIDLSLQKVKYDDDYPALLFRDRLGINTIKVKESGEYELINDKGYKSLDNISNVNIYLRFHGVYAEKMNKAFKHLSKLCYEKYGTKNDDPF